MNKIYLLILILFSLNLFSQDIGISGGYVINHFFDFEEETPHYSSDYILGNGFNIGLSVQNPIKIDSLIPLKVAINYRYFNGGANISTSGLGAGSYIESEVLANEIRADLYFVCLKPMRNLKFNLGTAFGRQFTKVKKKKSSMVYYYGELIKDEFIDKSAGFTFGIIAEILYEIQLKENYYLIPSVNFYYGLSRNAEDYYSYQCLFGVGIMKRL